MHRFRPAAARIVRAVLMFVLRLAPQTIDTPAGQSFTLARSRRRLVLIPPIAGGSGEGEGDGGDGGEGEGAGDGAGDGDEGDGGEGKGRNDPAGGGDGGEPDWKKRARQLERDLKRERTAKSDLAKTLKEQEDAQKSESQRAIDAAKKEAGDAVRAEVEAERRAERLEARTLTLAAKGIKVGDETRRFADPEYASIFLERAIRAGDVDADELFDGDGRVVPAKLTEALAGILAEHPRLADDTNNGGGGGRGSSDAGKGSAAATSSYEGLSPQQVYDLDRKASEAK